MVFGLRSNQADSIITISDEGHLSGASLDVFREESLPDLHPYPKSQENPGDPHNSILYVFLSYMMLKIVNKKSDFFCFLA